MKKAIKRMLSCILSAAMPLTMIPAVTLTAAAATDPIEIRTAAEFLALDNGTYSEAENKVAKSYILTEDIVISEDDLADDLAAAKAADPNNAHRYTSYVGSLIGGGYINVPFTGVFDGNGHTITCNIGTTESSLDNIGVFKENRGTIKNLTVAGTISGTGNAGGITAENLRGGLIYNCVNQATIVTTRYSTSVECYTGGIAGRNYWGGTIEHCANLGVVQGARYNGGIAGIVGPDPGQTWHPDEYEEKGHIINSFNMGTVFANSISLYDNEITTSGGIAGHVTDSDIRYCHSGSTFDNGNFVNTDPPSPYYGGITGFDQADYGGSFYKGCYFLGGNDTVAFGYLSIPQPGTDWTYSKVSYDDYDNPASFPELAFIGGDVIDGTYADIWTMTTDQTQNYPTFGYAEPVADVDGIEYTNINAALNNVQSGSTLKLLSDLVLSSSLTLSGTNLTLDLNGHSITAASQLSSPVLSIPENSSVTLADTCTGSAAVTNYYYIDPVTHLGVVVTDQEKQTAYDDAEERGSFKGGYISGGQGGVFVSLNSDFTMDNGTIIGNSSPCGAGVYAGGDFTMNGGNILGNVAVSTNESSGAGGVWILPQGQTALLGGKIMQNTTINEQSSLSAFIGGGVAVRTGTTGNAPIVGGTLVIKDNKIVYGDTAYNCDVTLYDYNNDSPDSFDSLLSVMNPESGMNVGITIVRNDNGTITNNAAGKFTGALIYTTAAECASYFFPSMPGVFVVAGSDSLSMVSFGELNDIDVEVNGEEASSDTAVRAGDTISVTALTAGEDPAAPVTYQWYKSKGSSTVAISDSSDPYLGKTSTYIPSTADVGYTLSVTVKQNVAENGDTLQTPVTKTWSSTYPVDFVAAPAGFSCSRPDTPYGTGGQIQKLNYTESADSHFGILYFSEDNGTTWNPVLPSGMISVSNNVKAGTYLFSYRANGEAISKTTTIILPASADLTSITLTADNLNVYDSETPNTLRVNTSISQPGPGTLTYTWSRVDNEGTETVIDNETESAYTLTADDVGYRIKASATWSVTSTTPSYVKTLSAFTEVITSVVPPTHSVNGTVSEYTALNSASSTPAQYAAVTLCKGNQTIAATTTDDAGSYNLVNIPDGVYNLVISGTYGTVTKQVTISGSDVENPVVAIPFRTESTVSVGANTPDVIVGNLDQFAAEIAPEYLASPADKVSVEFLVSSKEDITGTSPADPADTALKADQESILSEADSVIGSNATVEFLEMTITKTVNASGNSYTEPVRDTGDTVITSRIPFDPTGKYNINIFRNHVDSEGEATLTRFTEVSASAPKTDGTFVKGPDYLDVNSKFYSTYAIAYTTEEPAPAPAPEGGGSGRTSGGLVPDSVPGTVETPVQTEVSPSSTGVDELLNTVDHMAYISGYSDGSIKPDGNITRAEAAVIFYRLLKNRNVETTKSFSDVKAGAWYETAVNTLAGMGIINGYENGRFNPGATITRAEFTAIAARFAKTADGKTDFKDVTDKHWAYGNIVTAQTYGWIKGDAEGRFRPEGLITRAEVTTIVNRMLGRSADREFILANPDKLNSFSDLRNTGKWYYFDIMEAANAHLYTVDNGTETWA